jgi:hypothetical protein
MKYHFQYPLTKQNKIKNHEENRVQEWQIPTSFNVQSNILDAAFTQKLD